MPTIQILMTSKIDHFADPTFMLISLFSKKMHRSIGYFYLNKTFQIMNLKVWLPGLIKYKREQHVQSVTHDWCYFGCFVGELGIMTVPGVSFRVAGYQLSSVRDWSIYLKRLLTSFSGMLRVIVWSYHFLLIWMLMVSSQHLYKTSRFHNNM